LLFKLSSIDKLSTEFKGIFPIITDKEIEEYVKHHVGK